MHISMDWQFAFVFAHRGAYSALSCAVGFISSDRIIIFIVARFARERALWCLCALCLLLFV